MKIMSLIKNIHRISAKTLLLSIGLTLIACGGGGGGGGSDDTSSSPTGITYTGKTTEAEIDDSNTQSFSTATLDGSQSSQNNVDNLPIASVTTNENQQHKQYAMMTNLVDVIKDEANKNSTNPELMTGAVTNGTTVTAGNCGGSLTMTATSTATSANATMTFNSYCTEISGTTTTLAGSLSVVIGITDSVIRTMNISIPQLSISIAGSSPAYTNEFSGSINVAFDADQQIESMDVSVNFVEDGKVYKISNLIYTTSGLGVSISGTIYHPDHGYVTFITTEPFAISNEQLCGGTLQITGSNSSNVSITANNDCSGYTYTGTSSGSF